VVQPQALGEVIPRGWNEGEVGGQAPKFGQGRGSVDIYHEANSLLLLQLPPLLAQPMT